MPFLAWLRWHRLPKKRSSVNGKAWAITEERETCTGLHASSSRNRAGAFPTIRCFCKDSQEWDDTRRTPSYPRRLIARSRLLRPTANGSWQGSLGSLETLGVTLCAIGYGK